MKKNCIVNIRVNQSLKIGKLMKTELKKEVDVGEDTIIEKDCNFSLNYFVSFRK